MSVFGKSVKIEESRKRTDEVVRLFNRNASIEELEEPTMETLEFLWNEAQDLRARVIAQQKKEQGRSAKDYFDGVELGNLASKIAGKLGERGIKEAQEIALQIRLKVITVVQGHYLHIIGPAMLEHAALLESLGRVDEAAHNYDCVIADFTWLADDYTEPRDSASGEDLLSLESLKEALQNRMRIGGLSDAQRSNLQRQIQQVLQIIERSQ